MVENIEQQHQAIENSDHFIKTRHSPAIVAAVVGGAGVEVTASGGAVLGGAGVGGAGVRSTVL